MSHDPARRRDARPDGAPWRLEAAFWLTAALSAVHFAELHLTMTSWLHAGFAEALMRGEAATPFQYRVLMPGLARGVAAVGGLLGAAPGAEGIFRGLEAAAALGAMAALRRLLGGMFPGQGRACALLALMGFWLLALSLIMPRQQALFFPWDTPGVVAFALGLDLLRRRRWVGYYGLFVVATLNRETTCFLTLVHLLTSWGRAPGRALLGHVLAQAGVWLVIKLALRLAFADNPGAGLYELEHQMGAEGSHLGTNLAFLSERWGLRQWLSAHAFLWIPALLLGGQARDPFARRALWVIVPFMAGMLVVANVFELRIFAELLPVVLAAMASLILRPGAQGAQAGRRGAEGGAG